MKRGQAHIGMLVVFGMPDEEQTIAKIIVVNPVRAKVEALEARGGRPVGTKFNVPYHLMRQPTTSSHLRRKKLSRKVGK